MLIKKERSLLRIAALMIAFILLSTLFVSFVYGEEKSGFFKENGEWYYYQNGSIATDITGVVQDNSGKLVYVKNGKHDPNYSGIYKVNDNLWYCIDKGKVLSNYTGFTKSGGAWWYITKGRVNFSYTGFAKNSKGNWYYVENGKVTKTTNGLIKGTVNGSKGWYLVENSKVTKKTTVAQNEKGYWKVDKGKVNTGFKGLAKKSDGWWYFKKGKLNPNANGFAKYKNNWWYVVNGKVRYDKTGVFKGKIDGESGYWYTVEGKYIKNFTGLVNTGKGKKYCYVKDGKYRSWYSGPAQSEIGNKVWYHVNNGYYDPSFTGTFNDGVNNYNVKKGKIVKSYVIASGRSFYVNGKGLETDALPKSGTGYSSLIEISIAGQTLRYFEYGDLILSTPVVTGKPNSGSLSTPKGWHYVHTKNTDANLSGDDYSVDVDYWMGIDGVGYYGIHDASWRTSFGGSIYTYDPSHGCVNVPPSVMPRLFNLAHIGTDVYIY